MRKMSKLLFAAALATAAFLAVPPRASADSVYCLTCAADPTNCFACCKCAGGTTAYCTMWACH